MLTRARSRTHIDCVFNDETSNLFFLYIQLLLYCMLSMLSFWFIQYTYTLTINAFIFRKYKSRNWIRNKRNKFFIFIEPSFRAKWLYFLYVECILCDEREKHALFLTLNLWICCVKMVDRQPSYKPQQIMNAHALWCF